MGAAFLLGLCFFGAGDAAAAAPASVSYSREESRFYSSFYEGEQAPSVKSESVFYFNDGFGRLTEFRMTWKNHHMVLEIRRNMNVVGRKSCYAEQPRFSITREESMGRIYFRIVMGDNHYRGEIDGNDRWVLTEESSAPDRQTAEEWGQTGAVPAAGRGNFKK